MSDLFRRTYNGKRVLVTGHTGFKGAWLSLWLTQLGATVKGYALQPDGNSLYLSIEKDLKVESVIADIRDRERLEKEVLAFQPDFIFHLAAQPLVRYSYEQPVETFEVNAMGTAYLLQAITKLKMKCSVVIVTTDKVYENREEDHAYAEEDKLAGYDPYSSSKACAELIVQSYRLSFFNPEKYANHGKALASARAGNVIGGGDFSKDRILPDIIRALRNNEAVKIRNPRSIRPWQHVLDPLAGYLLLGARMAADPVKHSTAYNFGPDLTDSVTVEELVRTAIAAFGRGEYRIEPVKDDRHEAGLLKLNSEKAKRELGWVPVFSSTEAIRRTVEWYLSSVKETSLHRLCLADIKSVEPKLVS